MSAISWFIKSTIVRSLNNHRLRIAVIAAGLAWVTAASARGVTPDQLPELTQALFQAQPAPASSPLDLTAEMKAWVKRVAPRSMPSRMRLQLLLRAVLEVPGLQLQEVSGHTATAVEAFRSRRANCVALAFLLVALAREVDLPVYFVMTTQPEGVAQEGRLRVVTRHLAVGYGPPEQGLILDFGGMVALRSTPAPVQAIADRTATAIFFSNRGAELLLAGHPKNAIPWLLLALALDPTLPAAQDNLRVARGT